MRLRIRIFLTLAVVLAASFGVVAWWIETGLHDRLERLAADELRRTASVLAASIHEPFSDTLAERLGRTADLRVTLLGRDGRVVGDSDVPTDRIPRLESHANRPEVRAALEGRVGAARRPSTTVARSHLYVAVPHPQGIVRVAVPLTGVETTLVRTRRLELLGIGLGLVLAFFLSGWLAASIRRRLEEIQGAVEAVGVGDYSDRLGPDRPGSVGDLARAVDVLRTRLRDEVGDLRSEKENLQALFEGLEDALSVVDANGLVVRANSSFRRWAGRPRVIGQRFATLFRSPGMAEAVERALGGADEVRELTLGNRTLLLSAQPHQEGVLVVLRDLTRLRKLEGVRRDFVANVSHELKTPLTSLVGFAEAIAAGELSGDDSAEFGRRILVNAMRMRSLVDDLLDLAYVESGGWRPEPRTVAVPEVAREVWSGLQPPPEDRDVRLRVREEGLPPVKADPDALRQILRNLFDNAVRYAPEGSEVVVTGDLREDMIRVEVSDRGPGIPSAHQDRIFERFYRVDPARSREAGGTGLGLAIVKHLVLGHGGEIGVESELGLGTTLWFTLPAAGGFHLSGREPGSVAGTVPRP